MRFAPHTDDDISQMLATLGLSTLDDLFADIPPDVRLDRPLDIPTGISEMELVHDMRTLAARNMNADQLVAAQVPSGQRTHVRDELHLGDPLRDVERPVEPHIDRDVGEQVVDAREPEGREHLADVLGGVRREPHGPKSTVSRR